MVSHSDGKTDWMCLTRVHRIILGYKREETRGRWKKSCTSEVWGCEIDPSGAVNVEWWAFLNRVIQFYVQ